jgi:type II secretory pathway pseudopilin PulG
VETQTQIERQPKTKGEAGFMLVYAVAMVAIVMIGTAVAVPVMARQLRRDKEVESVHRMQQYVRAIQLYQRACKCTNYPPSMEALEKGTNVRFLRQEYVDPLTGKSDWRLIHNPQTTVKGFFGQELAGLVAGLGSAAGMTSGSSTPGATTPGLSTPGSTTTGAAPGASGGCNTVSAGGLASGFNGAQACTNGTSGSTGSAGSSDQGMFGDSSGGPIKGVGTSRTGSSILTPNDQTTYETWEFWYDPRIELLKKNVNILGGGGPAGASSTLGSTDASSFGNNLNGTPNGPGNNNNGTGTSTTPPGTIPNPTPQ